MTQVKTDHFELGSVFSKLLKRKVKLIRRIGGGRNSQVYYITCENGTEYAGKIYFHHECDDRDRLGTEFTSLQFLWNNGLRCVPRPIAADRQKRCAVYEYISGTELKSSDVSNRDIDYAVEFLVSLHELKSTPGSTDLPVASEACFSVQAVVDNVQSRFDRLTELPLSGGEYQALRKFLTNEFQPCFTQIIQWCRSELAHSGMDFGVELPREQRTLSPSDYGFHNALRRDNGEMVILDFEYFGWDDPAKMICDFLFHPAMDLRHDLKVRFFRGVTRQMSVRGDLPRRVEIVYPLFGLKWCMIILNEYVPAHMQRRGFADAMELRVANLQREQLAKAGNMLYRIMDEYDQFPYRDLGGSAWEDC